MGIMCDSAHIHVFHSMSEAGFYNSSCMHAIVIQVVFHVYTLGFTVLDHTKI
jgi:hypothetical protein